MVIVVCSAVPKELTQPQYSNLKELCISNNKDTLTKVPSRRQFLSSFFVVVISLFVLLSSFVTPHTIRRKIPMLLAHHSRNKLLCFAFSLLVFLKNILTYLCTIVF